MLSFRKLNLGLLTAVVIALVAFPVLTRASDAVGINPQSNPISVGGAVLKYTRQISIPRLSIPDSFTITDILENVGTAPAINVVIKQSLPAAWQVEGANNFVINVGDINAGVKVTKVTKIDVGESALTGRYMNEATVTADQLDPQTATAAIDLTKPAVLGAATSLAETGTAPFWSYFGLALMLAGAVLLIKPSSLVKD